MKVFLEKDCEDHVKKGPSVDDHWHHPDQLHQQGDCLFLLLKYVHAKVDVCLVLRIHSHGWGGNFFIFEIYSEIG